MFCLRANDCSCFFKRSCHRNMAYEKEGKGLYHVYGHEVGRLGLIDIL